MTTLPQTEVVLCPICDGRGRAYYGGIELKCQTCNGTGEYVNPTLKAAVPKTESPAQRDARHAYEKAKKRRDDLCDLHLTCDSLVDALRTRGFPVIAEAAGLVGIMLDNRMQEIGIENPIEEVVAFEEEFPVCRICALSDANCKCSRDDVRTDSSALAERG